MLMDAAEAGSLRAMSTVLPQLMSGVHLTGHGDVDRLVYREDIPIPVPADDQVLIALADETGSAIAGERFRRDLVSTEVRELFAADLELARRLGAHGFPSVVLERDDAITPLLAGWVDSRAAVSTVVAAVTG